MNKRILIYGILAILLITSATAAIVLWQPSKVYSGTATLGLGSWGIFSDKFSVRFPAPMRNTNYHIALEGFSVEVGEIWEPNGVLRGRGRIEKDCYVMPETKTINGFTGECNYKLYQTSMAYCYLDDCATFKELNTSYRVEKVGKYLNKVDWIVATDEQLTEPLR
jgi:hypothetical protein